MFRKVNAVLSVAIVAILMLPALAQPPTPLKVIGFMTDFDVKNDAVGICKAVMDGVAPGVRIIDIAHQSEPYNIAMGATSFRPLECMLRAEKTLRRPARRLM
jgi:hypothetical protein